MLLIRRPEGRPPLRVENRVRRADDPCRLLASLVRGKVPDPDRPVSTRAGEMLAVGMPVYGVAGFVMGIDLKLRRTIHAVVPPLDDAVLSAKGKLNTVGRRPLDVADALALARVAIAAGAGHDVLLHVAQVPETGGGVTAAGQQQVALVRVEGQLVDLAVVLVQLGQLDAGAIEIVQHDLAVGGGGGNVGAVVAMRPLDVVDLERIAVPGWRGGRAGLVVRSIVDDGGAQIGLFGALGASDADGLEDLSASEDGMCPLLIDVDGADVKAGLVACILRRQRAQPGGGQQRASGWRTHHTTHPGILGASGGRWLSGRACWALGGREP